MRIARVHVVRTTDEARVVSTLTEARYWVKTLKLRATIDPAWAVFHDLGETSTSYDDIHPVADFDGALLPLLSHLEKDQDLVQFSLGKPFARTKEDQITGARRTR